VRELDRALFRWINNWPDAFEPFFIFISEATRVTWVRIFLALLVIALLWINRQTRKVVLLALLAWPLANEFTEGMKKGFMMPRPDEAIHRVHELVSYGTASSHAANMAAIAFVFTYYFRWWGLVWIVFAFLSGLSRIYIGVHYPSQVLLGWIAGATCGFIVVHTWEAFVRLRARRSRRRTRPRTSRCQTSLRTIRNRF
jgi:undecaprenyl-diphosphatase